MILPNNGLTDDITKDQSANISSKELTPVNSSSNQTVWCLNYHEALIDGEASMKITNKVTSLNSIPGRITFESTNCKHLKPYELVKLWKKQPADQLVFFQIKETLCGA